MQAHLFCFANSAYKFCSRKWKLQSDQGWLECWHWDVTLARKLQKGDTATIPKLGAASISLALRESSQAIFYCCLASLRLTIICQFSINSFKINELLQTQHIWWLWGGSHWQDVTSPRSIVKYMLQWLKYYELHFVHHMVCSRARLATLDAMKETKLRKKDWKGYT